MSKLKSMELDDEKCKVLLGLRIAAIINLIIFLIWCYSLSTFTSRSCISTTENGRSYYTKYNEKFNGLLNLMRQDENENETTFKNILAIIFTFSVIGIFLMECWLCRTLIIGADESQVSYWYKWLLWRIILLVFYTACLVSIKVSTDCLHITSIIYLMYGFLSTIVIYEYKTKVIDLS